MADTTTNATQTIKPTVINDSQPMVPINWMVSACNAWKATILTACGMRSRSAAE